MGEVPIKYVFHGDREAGKGYMRRGAVMMDMLEHAMSYQGLRQGVMRRRPIRGVLIECDHRFGLRTVTITVDPTPVEIISPQMEDEYWGVVVAVSCSSGLYMHNGKWNGRPFSDGQHQYAFYMPIQDGYDFGPFSGASMHILHSWTRGTGMPKRPTTPGKFRDSFFDLFVRQTGRGYDREDARFAWYVPAVMPGFSGKDYILAHNLAYRADDDRIRYDKDRLKLAELTIQEWKRDGRQEPSRKWIYALRGMETRIGDGPLFRFAPLPERNGVRRFVALPGLDYAVSVWDPAIFSHVSWRSDGVRRFDFTGEMLKEAVLPAELEWDNRTGRGASNACAYMDGAGAVHVCFTLVMSDKRGTEHADNIDVTTTKWITSLIFVTLPALTGDMTPEEETAFLRDNMTVRALTWDRFLPLLDHLHSKVGTLPGGLYDVSGVNSILTAYDYWRVEDGYWYDLRSKTKPEYTIDGVVYNAGRMPYDISICCKFAGRDNEGWRGIIINAQAAQYVLMYAMAGDIPADSVVFHSGGETTQWYSWTRMWGGMSITPDGLSLVEMALPQEVETPGVKPDITWAGDGLYCCVCFDTCSRQVVAVYIGTPFDDGAGRPAWWSKIPLVSDEWAARTGNRILHVRPATVTVARVVLLAILKDGGMCRAAYCDGPPDTATLRFCGTIPLGKEEEDGMTLDICDFGAGDEAGEYAELLRTYPSPPRGGGAMQYSNIYKYADSRDGVIGDLPLSEFQEEWHDISEYD